MTRSRLTVVSAVTALLTGMFGVLGGIAQADAPALSGSTGSYTVAFGAGLPSGTSTVVASFTDYDASSSFGVVINWGDGTTSSNLGFGNAAVVAAGTLGGGNLFNVEANHNYPVPGAYPVTVDICDEPDDLFILSSCDDAADTSSNGGALFGAYTSSSPGILPLSGGTITVTDVAGTSSGFGIAEGASPTAQTVATFTDLDGSLAGELVATIDWGDGGCCGPDTSPGTVVATGPGAFSVTGTKPFPYPDEGSYPVNVTITDPTGVVPGSGTPLSPVVLTGGTVVVSDAPLTAGSPTTVNGTEGAATTYGPLGTFSDPGFEPFPCGGGFPFPPCAFAATIDWGDGGPTSAGDVSQSPCFLCPPPPWIVSGSHTYAEAGTYPITISVLDDGGSTVTLHGTAIIGDATLTPDSGPGPFLSGFVEGNNSGPINLGSFSDGNQFATASDFVATVCWNDLGTGPVNDCAALPASSVVSNGPPAGAFKVVASHVFKEEGSFTPSVKITDDDGNTIAALLNSPAPISVADHPLTVVRQPTLAVQVKKSFTKTVATFSDGTTGEPVTDYSAVICWYTYNCSTASGLNVTWTVGKITSNGAGGWTVTGTWKYAAAGAYNGSVTVIDSGGAPPVIAPVQAKAK